MIRRRLLLALLSNIGSWETFSQQYLYYTLIPQTINSKSVKNKAKVSKIYGNGVIENQLSPQANNGSISGLTITRNGGTFTINGTTGAAGHYIDNQVAFVSGHKYFIYAFFKNYVQNSGNAGMQVYNASVINAQINANAIPQNGVTGFFATATGTGNASFRFRSDSGIQFNNTEVTPQLIDLTLMFGTGNEPTTLTDNRIQNILNRGYIPYNLGTYKGTDIGEFKSESKNLCEHETLTAYSYNNDYLHFNQNNATKLKAGIYTFSCVPTTPEGDTSSQIYVQAFDIENTSNQYLIADIMTYGLGEIIWENKALYARKTFTFTLKRECYITICGKASVGVLTKPQIEIGNSATTYAPYKTFTPITFKAQLNGANTMEITKTNVIFTTNNFYCDLGTLTYSLYNGVLMYANVPAGKSNLGSSSVNIACEKYACNLTTQTGSQASAGTDKTCSYDYNNPQVLIKDTAYTDPATFKTAMAGVKFYYPLATPQVITIPRNKLGILDIGSASCAISGAGTANERISIWFNNIYVNNSYSSSTTYPIYCSKYMAANSNQTYSHTKDKIISQTTISAGGGLYCLSFYIYDSALIGKTKEEVLEYLSGTLLFYETENEVADITDTIDIESGGTITTDSEVLPNVDLSVKCK